MVKGIYVLLTMFLLMGCATVMNPYKMDNRMHKIELGMTKQKVISILGKDFESAGARITPDGPIESISYKTVTMTIADYSEGYYILSFKNGILVEWFKEKKPSIWQSSAQPVYGLHAGLSSPAYKVQDRPYEAS